MPIRMAHVHFARIPWHVCRRPGHVDALFQATLVDGINIVDPDRHPDASFGGVDGVRAEGRQVSGGAAATLAMLLGDWPAVLRPPLAGLLRGVLPEPLTSSLGWPTAPGCLQPALGLALRARSRLLNGWQRLLPLRRSGFVPAAAEAAERAPAEAENARAGGGGAGGGAAAESLRGRGER